MSKLDRFLVSEGLLSIFPSLSAICLDRHLSDHRPILMRELVVDYGPSPRYDVPQLWFPPNKKKLQALKSVIRSWIKDQNLNSNAERSDIMKRLADLDKSFDQGNATDDLVKDRSALLKDLHDINSRLSFDMAQKAKIRWSIEGDENSNFFHGILNKKRAQLAIRGVFVDGNWIDDPTHVKAEFLNHFSNRFSKPSNSSIHLSSQMSNSLSQDQVENLERNVTYDEIKRAVWDCGTNKSPGPDGFTFDFFRRYWYVVHDDVVKAVEEFFISGTFPPGCNALFISLIPKMQDAKLVKDFRPISLIGSLYKIIAKILANRLSLVISTLVSDVQSAFISNRQILDGPFILNELISWCKAKKSKTMVFKVDFEKAFDSLEWDFLDRTFWQIRFWVRNGEVLNAGLFKGVRIDNSLTLSHLFYADDAVFIGKWDKSNLITLVNMLKCFFLASGLKINIHKSKLMGIGVSQEELGGGISHSNSWDDIIAKVSPRLSKWKLKTLSIGGRLTLIKSVLSSMPLYHMSIYKVPIGVLNKLESLRRNFFNGVDSNERKFSMCGWKKVLASKNKGGLGVSNSSLWSRFIKAMYGDRGSIDNPGALSRKSPWSDIIKEVTALSRKGINFLSFIKKKVSVASKIADSSLSSSFRRVPRGGIEEEQLLLLVDKISLVLLSNSLDRWSWTLTSSGEFSVKSARNHIDDVLLPSHGSATRWVNKVPIKINILAWKVCKDILPTRFNLSLRGVDINSILCPVCHMAGESSSHLFFSCNVARLLFQKITRWWDLDVVDLFSY
ncbi:RNA-directed DNA polymerase, eukaryota [Tanacetum coccineum]